MRDVDTLIRTLSAFMRKKLAANEHKPHWLDEDYGQLLLGIHNEIYELMSEIANPESTEESIWCEAADVANYVSMVADFVTKRKQREGISNGFALLEE